MLGSLRAVLELLPLRRVMLIMEMPWAWSGQITSSGGVFDLPLHRGCIHEWGSKYVEIFSLGRVHSFSPVGRRAVWPSEG